jgi:hypothetical protein
MRLLTDREKIPAAVEAFAANINVVSPLFKEFSRVCEYNQSANSADKVRNFEETLRMPAEFLALLYAETQDPWVKKIAGFCFKDPQGVLPYTFFELMGLKETREWHSQTLSLAEGNQMVKLIEHAIMVPGYDFPLNWPAIGRLDQANRAELIAVVARAGQAGKEYWGRAQKVLAVIIRQADYFDLEETAKRELFASSIPPEFFAAYPKLLSAKFSTDLGL